VRICIVYDCIYPHTVGGLERWLRELAERLAAEGHEVDYVTLRQWPEGTDAGVPGVRVIAVGPEMELYGRGGRRRIFPPLRFGVGVLAHLARHGGRYDAVHTAAFPYFSLLAAALVRPFRGYRLVVDWFEVWTLDYWREYLGRAGGIVGYRIQELCLRLPQRAFCFSQLHEARMRAQGFRGQITVLRGLSSSPPGRFVPAAEPPTVAFAGRHIPEKRVPSLIPAIARARERIPDLRCEIFGDGPDRHEVLRAVGREGLGDVVDVHGFVPIDRVEQRLATALCLVLPSRREGYGLVVVEAASAGTPTVLVEGSDNAAVEFIEEGVNGFVTPSAAARDLADAIVQVAEGGAALRKTTAEWFEANREPLSLSASLDAVVRAYEEAGHVAASARR
jgi:glycosyltransferase involved in cell wall biosynthesis